jgi:SPP1 family predicted phage head-tail adaptor
MVVKCSKYSAGDLREPVTFERVTRVPDGVGGWAETWSQIAGAPARAMVRQVSGREAWAFDRINARADRMVVVRFHDGLTPADRVTIRGRAHNIAAINNLDFADRWLEIAVTEGVPS